MNMHTFSWLLCLLLATPYMHAQDTNPANTKKTHISKAIPALIFAVGALAVGGSLYYFYIRSQTPSLDPQQQEKFDTDFRISLQASCVIEDFDDLLKKNPGANLQSVLYSAINYGRFDVAQKLLIEYNANPNFHIKVGIDAGQTPLIRSVKTDKPEFHKITQILSEHGANLNGCDKSNMTALHFAAAGGNTEAITLLKKAGANLNAKDINDWTPLKWAQEYRQQEAADLLKSYGAVL